MAFIILLALTTLSIAGSAAFFSVYGLAQIFSGSFWPVVIMATSLETGKLVAASYTYRYWFQISTFLRTYLIVAILVLMAITSAGIFGFLSAAHQQDVLPQRLNEQRITLLHTETEQLEQLKTERLDRKRQIDADVAGLPNNFVKGRQRLIETYKPELEQLERDIAQYTEQIRSNSIEISKLKNVVLMGETEIGPIIFIAKVFSADTDNATKWLILIIIFVFDPLAVALTLGTNIALSNRLQQPSKKSGTTLQQGTEFSIQQIRDALQELEQQKSLSPAEIAQKAFLEELLKKREVTEALRKGT